MTDRSGHCRKTDGWTCNPRRSPPVQVCQLQTNWSGRHCVPIDNCNCKRQEDLGNNRINSFTYKNLSHTLLVWEYTANTMTSHLLPMGYLYWSSCMPLQPCKLYLLKHWFPSSSVLLQAAVHQGWTGICRDDNLKK